MVTAFQPSRSAITRAAATMRCSRSARSLPFRSAIPNPRSPKPGRPTWLAIIPALDNLSMLDYKPSDARLSSFDRRTGHGPFSSDLVARPRIPRRGRLQRDRHVGDAKRFRAMGLPTPVEHPDGRIGDHQRRSDRAAYHAHGGLGARGGHHRGGSFDRAKASRLYPPRAAECLRRLDRAGWDHTVTTAAPIA